MLFARIVDNNMIFIFISTPPAPCNKIKRKSFIFDELILYNEFDLINKGRQHGVRYTVSRMQGTLFSAPNDQWVMHDRHPVETRAIK